MAKTKKKKNKSDKATEAVVAQAITRAEGTDEPKKKKYERKVRIKAAGVVANFLCYNAKDFRGKYAGDGEYAFRVSKEDKDFLDALIDRLKDD